MAEPKSTSIRALVLEQIANKRRKVVLLRAEEARVSRDISRLQRILQTLERDQISSAPAVRSTSARRLIVEQLILRRLDLNSPRETSSDELWSLVERAGVSSRSTFRSHLRRMAERGLIYAISPGKWRLSPDTIVRRKTSPELEDAVRRISSQ